MMTYRSDSIWIEDWNMALGVQILKGGGQQNVTAFIAINLGDIAIIAADKKEVFIQGDFVIPIHESANKIIDSGIGLMTGSGYVSLLQDVKDQVANCTIKSTDQILSLISAARQKLQEFHGVDEHQKTKNLCTTGWLFTYLTSLNGERSLRVALFHPSLSTTQISIIDVNRPKILFPSDINEAQAAYYSRQLSDHFMPVMENKTDEALSINIGLILQIFSELSGVSQSVSAAVDIGLVTSSGEQYIAESATVDSGNLDFVPFRS
jgi:hypothetical protein